MHLYTIYIIYQYFSTFSDFCQWFYSLSTLEYTSFSSLISSSQISITYSLKYSKNFAAQYYIGVHLKFTASIKFQPNIILYS